MNQTTEQLIDAAIALFPNPLPRLMLADHLEELGEPHDLRQQVTWIHPSVGWRGTNWFSFCEGQLLYFHKKTKLWFQRRGGRPLAPGIVIDKDNPDFVAKDEWLSTNRYRSFSPDMVILHENFNPIYPYSPPLQMKLECFSLLVTKEGQHEPTC